MSHCSGPAMNEGPVCAFDEKVTSLPIYSPTCVAVGYCLLSPLTISLILCQCGNIQTFASKEDAGSANYTIAHCGACGSCSNWNDFALQPTDLATPANACGKKHLFDGLFAAASCIETDIGFTAECAWVLVHDILIQICYCVLWPTHWHCWTSLAWLGLKVLIVQRSESVNFNFLSSRCV